jgi:hypothetical protein
VHEDGEQSKKFNSMRIILASFTCSRKPDSPNTFLSTLFSTGLSQSVYWLGCWLNSFHFVALLSYRKTMDKRLRIKQPTRCIKYPKLYFVIKLDMFRASSVPIIRSYLLYARQLVCFMQVSDDRFLAESGWNTVTMLGSGHITCMKYTNCRVYSR